MQIGSHPVSLCMLFFRLHNAPLPSFVVRYATVAVAVGAYAFLLLASVLAVSVSFSARPRCLNSNLLSIGVSCASLCYLFIVSFRVHIATPVAVDYGKQYYNYSWCRCELPAVYMSWRNTAARVATCCLW